MENLILKTRILSEMERLIDLHSSPRKLSDEGKTIHESIVKQCYNAADVQMDYHRRRINMHLVMDDALYSPEKLNVNLPVLPMNLYYIDLRDFLKSCLQEDAKSLALYARILRDHSSISLEELSA
ncbi:hypothetical protein [Croceivirga sp. JEA036]|uniref:hypothetical protein n=1 Tax=Croceivirga sp. JEA036 TaxID=2721162 RepID=UPI00143C80EB|nr:hypothetical protein [Croceivirga sp. JEA036]NJB36466.1 hypothetical protein [Croceivirga sp. JEA036]